MAKMLFGHPLFCFMQLAVIEAVDDFNRSKKRRIEIIKALTARVYNAAVSPVSRRPPPVSRCLSPIAAHWPFTG
ncbi:MAG: hypothetical protein ACOX5T_02355 [Candidatus Cryptobacteroides sp.]|jgi:hypothetical protein